MFKHTTLNQGLMEKKKEHISFDKTLTFIYCASVTKMAILVIVVGT